MNAKKSYFCPKVGQTALVWLNTQLTDGLMGIIDFYTTLFFIFLFYLYPPGIFLPFILLFTLSYSFCPISLYASTGSINYTSGSLLLPTAALLTGPVNTHSRCMCGCACVYEKLVDPIGLRCITAFLSVLSHLSVCQTSCLSVSLCVPAPVQCSR